jgi:hypothetical protein
MDAARIQRIETNVERGASATLAGAVGYAVYGLLCAVLAGPELWACAVGGAALAYVICSGMLGAISPRKPRFAVPVFDVRQIDPNELLLTEAERLTADELVLTEADRLTTNELLLTDADRLGSASMRGDPLVLDDILAELGPDARVVRLFDRKAMPTPGQLKSQIDTHLSQASPSAGASDASQALSDALAELRRSLR